MTRICTATSWLALGATILCVIWLARLEAGGPARASLELRGGVPATLYLPASGGGGRFLPQPPSAEDRPPVIVLAHGYASDRSNLSVLARALVQAGYAVLTLDLRGHGANRNSFASGRGSDTSLIEDLGTAVDFLRTSPHVDGARIVVMGHSMGAGAALAYAVRDSGLDATVLISSGRGWLPSGPYRPPNALFLLSEGAPAQIRGRALAIVGALAGVESPKAGVVYGDFAMNDAASYVEVARANHATIVFSSYAARQIIGWLDDVYGIERGTFFLRADPRVRTALIGLVAFVLLLPGLGIGLGRLTPRLAERPSEGALGRLGALVLALCASLPLVAVGGVATLLPIDLADTVTLLLFVAGTALLVWQLATDRWSTGALRWAATALPAAGGALAIYLLMAPFGVVIHTMALTPERFVIAALMTVLSAPFWMAFHMLLRRGRPWVASAWSLLGRAALLGVLILAVSVGILSPVLLMIAPVLAGLFVLFEILAAAVYATSRNWTTIAFLESIWLAWVLAAVLPVRA